MSSPERNGAADGARGLRVFCPRLTMYTDRECAVGSGAVRCVHPGDGVRRCSGGCRNRSRAAAVRSSRPAGGQTIQAPGPGRARGNGTRMRQSRCRTTAWAGGSTCQAPRYLRTRSSRAFVRPHGQGRRSTGRSLERPAPPRQNLGGTALRGRRRFERGGDGVKTPRLGLRDSLRRLREGSDPAVRRRRPGRSRSRWRAPAWR
jgi:hypothetical protein